MEALGDELFNYLEEAGRVSKKKEKTEAPKKGLKEKLFGDFINVKKKEKKKKALVPKGNFGAANGHAKFHCYNGYKVFKKSHRMVHW